MTTRAASERPAFAGPAAQPRPARRSAHGVAAARIGSPTADAPHTTAQRAARITPRTADATDTTAERAARAAAASALGHELAEALGDPQSVASIAAAGLRGLASEHDRRDAERVSPGIGPIVGVSFFMVERVARAFLKETRRDSPANVLIAANALFGVPFLEARWLAFPILERLVSVDPERTWQLLRRASREAADWITVDALAHPVGRGILAEPVRWAELGQLVFAPSPWERRLVGSTIATIPFVDRREGRTSDVVREALPLVGALIGDDRPEVQKALSWALRSLTIVDPSAVAAFCEHETDRAVEADDGHRAWVVRDTLSKLDAESAERLRGRLAAIRKRPHAPSTSDAAAIAREFVASGGTPPLGGAHVERIPVSAR